MSQEHHSREQFEQMYAAAPPPWDIGRPQRAFVAAAERVSGRVLDAGCGTGENALYLAERGHDVTGIDYLETPIAAAQRKAKERNLQAEFLVRDATQLSQWDARFETIIDCGLFHVFSDEDRARYVAGLENVCLPGGQLLLMCFSDREPGTQGPRRISEAEFRSSFAAGWSVESLEPSRFEGREEDAKEFTAGGPHAWFAEILRDGS